MISALIESYIRAYAGKYLKNFSSDKLVIGFNTIKLTNLEVSTEHLWKFKMPFRPVRAFVGEISVDLSFVLGGKLEVNVKDVLFIFEKEQYDEVINPQIILDSLQALISVVYFTADYPFNTSLSDSFSQGIQPSIDLESIHRLIDRASVNIENLHFRVEEMYSGLASSSSGDMMCMGTQVGKLQIRSATSKEIFAEKEKFLPSSKYPVVINKLINLEEFLLYCKWDNPLLESELGEITANLVRSTMLSAGSEGIILQPVGGRITLAAAFQKGSLLLRPVKIHADFQNFSFHITNEQVLYLYHFIDFFREYPSRLQALSRVVLMQPCPWGMDRSLWVQHSASHRARLRWSMIRRQIKSDWWRHTSFLKEGSIRWRTWFEIWVHAARYVALREILMYHVGYESFYDEVTHMYNYAIRENLKMYYSSMTGAEFVPAGQGSGGTELIYLRLAEKYLQAQISACTTNSPYVFLDMEKDKEVLKALYAMQLEYDAFLPYRIAAFCRRRAEEKYVRRVQRSRREQDSSGDGSASNAPTLLTNVPLLITAPPLSSKTEEFQLLQRRSEENRVYLLFSVIDVSNLSPSFASSLVQCSISSRLCWSDDATTDSPSSLVNRKLMMLGETKLLSNRVSKLAYEAAAKTQQNAPKTFVQSNHVFSLPLHDFTNAFHNCSESLASSGGSPDKWLESVLLDRQVIFEVIDRSMMTLSLGKNSLPLSSLHPDLMDYIKISSTVAQLSSSNFDVIDTNLDCNSVSLRIVTKMVRGPMDELHIQIQEFQDAVSSKLLERRPILERALFADADPNMDLIDEEESFILDPSQITVQEVLVEAKIPQVKLQMSAVYAIPVEVRSNILAEHGMDLPRTQHLPFLSVLINTIQMKLHAANNPLTMSGDASFDSLLVQDIRPHHGTKETLPRFSITLPRAAVHMELSQISTLSRYLDGHWDASCFESLFRFSIGGDPYNPNNLPAWLEVFIPRPIMSAEADAGDMKQASIASFFAGSTGSTSSKKVEVPKTLVWRSRRNLAHLFNPISKWSQVINTISRSHFEKHTVNSNGSVSEPSEEYKLRFGDWYTLYPRHLNVVNRVFSWLTFSGGNNETGKVESQLILPTQKLHVSAATSARSLDCSLVLAPPSIYLPTPSPVSSSANASEHTKSILIAEPVPMAKPTTANSLRNAAPTASNRSSQQGVWLGWWPPAATASSSVQAAPITSGIHSETSLSQQQSQPQPDHWETERAKLQLIISQLEKENMQLKELLRGHNTSVTAPIESSNNGQDSAAQRPASSPFSYSL